MRIPGPDSADIAALLINGLEDCEFSIPGHVVADIALADEPERQPDGSLTMMIEALTVEE